MTPAREHDTSKATGSIPALDGWRALSVLLVLVSHSGYGHIVPGGLGVTIFFFISGYLITTLLEREMSLNGHLNIRYFYLRRFLRLTPSLLVTLSIAYALLAFNLIGGGISVGGLSSQVLYFYNYVDQVFVGQKNLIPEGTGVLWSLAVEEHFYLIYPGVLALLLRKLGAKRSAIFFSMICLMVLAWRYYLAESGSTDLEQIYYRTDTRIDSMLFGCILALAFQPINQHAGIKQVNKMKAPLLIALSGALMMTSLLIRDPVFHQTLRYSLQGLALMPIFYFSIQFASNRPFIWLNHPWLVAIGQRSYAIYLFHFICIRFLLRNTGIEAPSPVLALASFVLAILYAELLERTIERRFKVIRSRFR